MKNLELIQVKHSVSIGDHCGYIEPNVMEDTIFLDGGKAIGFYIADMGKYSAKAVKLADVANAELLSKRVPKSTMKRSSGMISGDKSKEVLQYSTIIGSVPPKPHMRRNYPTRSSVHNVDSARTFVKAMTLLCEESEDIVKRITPGIFEHQTRFFNEHVREKWRLGRMFTSSISNFNIAAAYHRDAANIEGCVNIIIAKRWRADGGHTTIPDYGATVNSANNSMLVYPAWRNVHGVTPIEVYAAGGYRNSLVFYPLKAFVDLD